MAGPGLPHGLRVSSPASNRHWVPTLARLAGEMQAVIERLQSELEARRPAPRVGAGEGTREMLREIGYAGGEE